MVVNGDALGELDQIASLQQGAQPRLARENNLKGLSSAIVQIRQEPELFKHRRAEILGLVHDQHDSSTLIVLTSEKRCERSIQFNAVHPFSIHIEGHQYPGHERAEARVRIRQDSHCDLMLRLIENRIEQRGLPRPRLTSDHGKHRTIEQPVLKETQGQLVLFPEKQKSWIRSEREGIRPKPVERFVHVMTVAYEGRMSIA